LRSFCSQIQISGWNYFYISSTSVRL